MNPAGYDRKRCNEKCKNKGVEERLLLHGPSVARVASAVEDQRWSHGAPLGGCEAQELIPQASRLSAETIAAIKREPFAPMAHRLMLAGGQTRPSFAVSPATRTI